MSQVWSLTSFWDVFLGGRSGVGSSLRQADSGLASVVGKWNVGKSFLRVAMIYSFFVICSRVNCLSLDDRVFSTRGLFPCGKDCGDPPVGYIHGARDSSLPKVELNSATSWRMAGLSAGSKSGKIILSQFTVEGGPKCRTRQEAVNEGTKVIAKHKKCCGGRLEANETQLAQTTELRGQTMMRILHLIKETEKKQKLPNARHLCGNW